jgi:hypothetical protein
LAVGAGGWVVREEEVMRRKRQARTLFRVARNIAVIGFMLLEKARLQQREKA